MRRLLSSAVIATLALLTVAPTPVRADPMGPGVSLYEGYFEYDAAPGQTNNVTISGGNPPVGSGSGTFRVTDVVPFRIGSNCFAVPSNPLAADCVGHVNTMTVNLSGGDDIVTVTVSYVGSTSLIGGNGNDTLRGDSLSTIMYYGGPGNDTLRGGAGTDIFDGGPGDDRMTGAGGLDSVRYGDRLGRVVADIDGQADDGEAGERDRIDTDVEGIVGGAASDVLTGNASANHFWGGPGEDVLYGMNGDDILNGEAGADVVYGGNGNDTLYGGPGLDIIDGAAGADTCDAGTEGADLISC